MTRVNAARYCNYLTNGRGDTENGAYVIRNIRLFDGKHYDVTSGPRDLTTPDAPVVYYLPSLDEWYKSAYFDLRSKRYIDDRRGGNAGITLSNGREWLEKQGMSSGGRKCRRAHFYGSPGNVDGWEYRISSCGDLAASLRKTPESE